MKQQVWGKALLTGYNHLETITNTIDEMVLNYGKSSAFNSYKTLENIDKILNLTERKKLLINLKVLIETALSELDVLDCRILVLKYFDKITSEKSAKILNISIRTYFRKLKTAIDNFANKLKNMGFTDAKFAIMFKSESWICELYNLMLLKDNKVNYEISQRTLFNLAFSICKNDRISYGRV